MHRLTGKEVQPVLKSQGHDVRRSDDAFHLAAIVAKQNQLIEEQRAELQALKTDLGRVKSELQDFKVKVANDSYTVAFSACLRNSADLTSDPRLKFDNVGLNIGQGYNPGTFTFVAPVSGLYMLSFKVIGATEHVRFAMMQQDGQLIAETGTAQGGNARAFVQTLQPLTSGDSVWVERMYSGLASVVGGGVDTCFYGYLLNKL
ncbi:uncharacterized protein [Littorina saxatilis]|uniref:uncharacterized protein n=1 Tax=Littorina saxatilis TaxID=31220 RepID=UPI0038B64447